MQRSLLIQPLSEPFLSLTGPRVVIAEYHIVNVKFHDCIPPVFFSIHSIYAQPEGSIPDFFLIIEIKLS